MNAQTLLRFVICLQFADAIAFTHPTYRTKSGSLGWPTYN